MKFLLYLLLFFTITLPASAAIRINEFSSRTNPDWVEIYNSSTESADLTVYRIRDTSDSNKIDLSGSIPPGGFATFDFSDRLNNDGDKVKLFKIEGGNETLIEEISYGSEGGQCAPSESQSIGRLPDGGGNVVRFASFTKNGSNNPASIENCPAPTPTNTPGPTSTPTPGPTQTPTPAPAATATPKPSATPKVSTTPVVNLIPTISMGEPEMVNANMNQANNSLLTLDPTPAVLGDTAPITPTKNNRWIPIALIILGTIGLGITLFLLFKHARGSKSENDEPINLL